MCFGFRVMIRQTRDLADVADWALAAWGGWIEPRDLPEQIRAFVERVGSLATLWKAWVGCPPKRHTSLKDPRLPWEDSSEEKIHKWFDICRKLPNMVAYATAE